MYGVVRKLKRKGLSSALVLLTLVMASHCIPLKDSPQNPVRNEDPWSETGPQYGREVLPGIVALTGYDLKPFQTEFRIPELADPYATILEDSAIISGTAQYYLKFRSVDDIRKGGPYQFVWNDYYYADRTPMEGARYYAHSWDMKPELWSISPRGEARLWDPARDSQPPVIAWYGGHMRPRAGYNVSHWPEDNFSRDVFAFVKREPDKWFSLEESIFSVRQNWPRPIGNFLGHRYGHQFAMVPRLDPNNKFHRVPAVFYEEVTDIRGDGAPAVTRIFMDEMTSPYLARGAPVELVSPIDPLTGRTYPSALREDGGALVEGPIYFRFKFDGELWEAIGFSAGSFYAGYSSCFASRRVADGLRGGPFRVDLEDDGSDFHNAGAELGRVLNLAGGPGRPAVMVGRDGTAIPGPNGELQVLVHAYRRDILPDNDYGSFPTKYRLDQMFRVVLLAPLQVSKGRRGNLRFDIAVPKGKTPDWTQRLHSSLPWLRSSSQV